jgi:hypothetical protein
MQGFGENVPLMGDGRHVLGSPVGRFAFALAGTILLIGNHAISEYLRWEADMPLLFKLSKADRILQLAQQTGDQAIADAQREAEEILVRACQEAEHIIADARTRAGGF